MTRIIVALLAGAAGIALTLAGLGVDGWLHAQHETLAAREGIFTLSSPGHAMLAAGMALASGGILSALYIAWGMSQVRGIPGRRWVRVVSMQAAGAASVGAVLFAMAASASGHEHTANDGAASHAHDGVSQPAIVSGGDPALAVDALAVAEPHTHTAAPALSAAAQEMPAEMPDAGAAMPAASGAAHAHPKPTADELACLAGLTAQAKAATARFDDFSVAAAEGYVTNELDPSKTHHPNRAYKRDGVIFDLSKPESLIYVTQDDGSKRFIGVLYHAPVGQGPTPCGNATYWHTHGQCIDSATGAATPESKDKTCAAGQEHREGNAEMMHLWFVARGSRS